MNTSSATPFGLPDTAPELARRFAAIMAGLAALVARRFLRMPHLSGMTLTLWGYLNRAVRRFHRALTQPAKPRASQVRSRLRVARPARAQVRLPSQRAWIVRELGWEAAGYLAQLEALLTETASQVALADAPNAAGIMRPICRMLGVSRALTPKIAPAARAEPGRTAQPPPLAALMCMLPIMADDQPAILGATFSSA